MSTSFVLQKDYATPSLTVKAGQKFDYKVNDAGRQYYIERYPENGKPPLEVSLDEISDTDWFKTTEVCPNFTGCGTHKECPNCLNCDRSNKLIFDALDDMKPKSANFGIFMPPDIARNPDRTPKMFDAEKATRLWHDEPKMWDSYEDVKERERLQTDFNKKHFKFRGPDDIGFNQ